MDEQEPRPLRPQQVAISERSDRRRMAAGRTADPTWQDWRWRAIPKDLPPKSSVYDYFDLWAYDGTLARIHHSLYERCREQAQREASPTAAIIDSQSVKSAEKGGAASIRTATMQARRSKARSGIFSSTR